MNGADAVFQNCAIASCSASSGVTSIAAVGAEIGRLSAVVCTAVPIDRTRMFDMNSFEIC